MSEIKVKIIGCGGIGTCLIDVLCRYLQHSDYSNVEVSLIDGDTYEERNRERQVFNEIGPKASVTAARLRSEFPRLVIFDKPVYLNEKNVITHIRENDFVFSCVDNHKTRKIISDRAEELKNVTVISGGNEKVDGNFQIHVRRDNKNHTVPISYYHNEIQNPSDNIPGDSTMREGCQQMVSAEPQLLIMNNLVASHMLSGFYGVLNNYYANKPEEFSEFYIDMPSGKVIPAKRPLPKSSE
jgi:molybdopterin/thiamine biosynthesis adenylyltransferase